MTTTFMLVDKQDLEKIDWSDPNISSGLLLKCEGEYFLMQEDQQMLCINQNAEITASKMALGGELPSVQSAYRAQQTQKEHQLRQNKEPDPPRDEQYETIYMPMAYVDDRVLCTPREAIEMAENTKIKVYQEESLKGVDF